MQISYRQYKILRYIAKPQPEDAVAIKFDFANVTELSEQLTISGQKLYKYAQYKTNDIVINAYGEACRDNYFSDRFTKYTAFFLSLSAIILSVIGLTIQLR